jgi:hypothetical protein
LTDADNLNILALELFKGQFNQMNKYYFPLIVFSVIFISMGTMLVKEDGRAGSTGSPGEATCNTSLCHSGNSVNSNNGSITIESPDLIDWQYIPGETYTISVTVAQTNRNLFGIGFEALTSTNNNAGILTPGDDTQLKNRFIQGVSRVNVVHVENGGASSDAHTFIFSWQAPATDIGNITFYAAGNAANNNGSASGDFIYTTNQVITPLSTVGVTDLSKIDVSLNVYPNPAADDLNFTYYLTEPALVRAEIFTISGESVRVLFEEKQQPGETFQSVRINDLSYGTYLLRLNIGNEQLSRLFVR